MTRIQIAWLDTYTPDGRLIESDGFTWRELVPLMVMCTDGPELIGMAKDIECDKPHALFADVSHAIQGLAPQIDIVASTWESHPGCHGDEWRMHVTEGRLGAVVLGDNPVWPDLRIGRVP